MANFLMNYNTVVKETAKAICLNCPVYWGEGSMKQRDIWFPKSVVELKDNNCAVVSLNFIRNKEREMAYNGYEMNFDGQQID